MEMYWLLLVAVGVIWLQGALYGRFGKRGLTYERFFSAKACFPGDEVEMVERIANRKLLPAPWVRLESLIHADLRFQGQSGLTISEGEMFQNHRSLFSLMPYTQIVRRHKIAALRRGCYRLNTATLTTGDMLGLNRSSITMTLDAELLVYPQLLDPQELQLPSHSWQGDATVRRWIVDDPFMISGVREYRYGDPLGGINWKATARTGRLQVHQRDFTAEHRLIICVNVEDHEGMWSQVNDEELFERGLSYSAAFAQMAIERGMETGFATNAYTVDEPKEPVRVEPGSGAPQMEGLLQTMARLVVARSIPFDTLLEQEAERAVSNVDYLLVSAYVSEKMEAQINRLRRNGNAVDFFMLERQDNGAERREGESA